MIKLIIAVAFMTLLMGMQSFAGSLKVQSGFPFDVYVNMDAYDKLCYAGHAPGGGMFYDDGFMVTPGVSMTIIPRYGNDDEVMNCLSAEVDLIYENADNSSCVKEVIRKFDFGDIKIGKENTLLTETATKNLKQRKKLYSSDVMSIKIMLTYKPESGTQKKQGFLLYLAKDDEYASKTSVLSAPPGAQ